MLFIIKRLCDDLLFSFRQSALTLLFLHHRVLKDLRASQEPQVTLEPKERRYDSQVYSPKNIKYESLEHKYNLITEEIP